jgi:hypothetical protein
MDGSSPAASGVILMNDLESRVSAGGGRFSDEHLSRKAANRVVFDESFHPDRRQPPPRGERVFVSPLQAVALLLLTSLAFAPACAGRRVPTTPVAAIDTLTYIIGDESLWPRRGTQLQHQIVDRNRRQVCWVKYGDARKFECWRWDDHWIYHEVDHALDGDSTGRSYRFSDGRWLPRRLSGTWTLDVRHNRAIDLTPTCGEHERRFPYRLRAYVEPPQEIGGDLGRRSTLVLEYQPYDPDAPPRPETVERFLFAEGAGWYAWASARGVARFDRIGGPVMSRVRWCGER